MGRCDSEVNITVDNAITLIPDSGRKYSSYLISLEVSQRQILFVHKMPNTALFVEFQGFFGDIMK